MDNKNYKEALVELSEFIKQRDEIIKVLEESIDKYIIDRTLPFEYKEKYVQWQQDLIDVCEEQLKNAKEYKISLKEYKE